MLYINVNLKKESSIFKKSFDLIFRDVNPTAILITELNRD